MCVQQQSMQAKVKAFESNAESVRILRQERLAADTRALLAESRVENLRLEVASLNSKLQRALRRFVPQAIRVRVFSQILQSIYFTTQD